MSSPRTTLAAVAVAALLGGVYWGWVLKWKPGREKAKEDAKVLFADLDVAKTGEILLRKKGSADVLLRRSGDHWQLAQPIQAPADDNAVAALATALGTARRDETVVEKDADLREFGLDVPSGGVTFRPVSAGAKPQVLFFGMDNPTGTDAYALIDGQPQVFLTSLSLKAQVLKDAAALRDKTLWRLNPAAVTGIRSTVGRPFSAVRDKLGVWQVTADGATHAGQPDSIVAWIRDLDQLRADKVPSEDGKGGSWGLKPGKRVEVTLSTGPALALVEGAKAKDGGFYVQIQGAKPVYTLPESARSVVERLGKDLMDLKAFSFNTADVRRFEIERGGQKLTAVKTDRLWSWQAPPGMQVAQTAFDFDGFIARFANAQWLRQMPKAAKPAKALSSVTFWGANGVLLEKAELAGKSGKGVLAVSAIKNQTVVVAANLLDGLPDVAPVKAAAPAPPAGQAQPDPGPAPQPVPKP